MRLVELNETHTVGWTPLDGGPARCTDPYVTTHDIHKIQTSMSLAGFESTIPESKWAQTYASHRGDMGIGAAKFRVPINNRHRSFSLFFPYTPSLLTSQVRFCMRCVFLTGTRTALHNCSTWLGNADNSLPV